MFKELKVRIQTKSLRKNLEKFETLSKPTFLKNNQKLSSLQRESKNILAKDKSQKSSQPKENKVNTENSLQNAFKRSKSLINFLNKKGLKGFEEQYQMGMMIYEKEKQKFLKPLKMNHVTPYIAKSKIDKLCEKYEINKQFYENPPEDLNGNPLGFDPEMSNFIKHRKNSLESIKQKKPFSLQKTTKISKFPSVQSVKQRKTTAESTSTLPSSLLLLSKLPITLNKERLLNEAKEIIQMCDNLKEYKNSDKFSPNVLDKFEENLTEQAIQNNELKQMMKIKVRASNSMSNTYGGRLQYYTYDRKCFSSLKERFN